MKKQLTVSFWREAYSELCQEVEQVLGKALGYPYYAADQKNFPGTVLADGVCTGDNVPESLLAEASRKLTEQKTNGMEFKSLVFDEFPCTAAVEVQWEKLATYFDRRARENAKRAEKLEGKLTTFTSLVDIVKSERGAYYFSGKEDSYKKAARKIRELLASTHTWSWEYYTKPATPEVWVVEFTTGDGWHKSVSLHGEYSTLAEANAAIEALCKAEPVLNISDYRVVRK